MVDSDKGRLGNDVLTRLSPDISAGRRFAELQAIDRERKQPEVIVVRPVTAGRAGTAIANATEVIDALLEIPGPSGRPSEFGEMS